MSYFLQRFYELNASTGSLKTLIGQFFANNPACSVRDIYVSHRESPGFGVQLTATIIGTFQGGQLYSVEFQSVAGSSADQQVNTFFAANPTFIVLFVLNTTGPEKRYLPRNRLLVIYSIAVQCEETAAASQMFAADAVDVAQAGNRITPAFGIYDVIQILNLGNMTWPAGGKAIAFRNSPLLGGAACGWAGIAPCCYTGTAPPATTTVAPTTTNTACLINQFATSATVTPPPNPTTTPPPITSTTTTTSTTSTTTTQPPITTSTSSTTTTGTGPPTTTSSTTTTTTTTAACAGYNLAGAGPEAHPGLPANACAGFIDLTVTTAGQASAQGIIITVTTDQGGGGVTACLTVGTVTFNIPATATVVNITSVVGCSGGAGAGATTFTWSLHSP